MSKENSEKNRKIKANNVFIKAMGGFYYRKQYMMLLFDNFLVLSAYSFHNKSKYTLVTWLLSFTFKYKNISS